MRWTASPVDSTVLTASLVVQNRLLCRLLPSRASLGKNHCWEMVCSSKNYQEFLENLGVFRVKSQEFRWVNLIQFGHLHSNWFFHGSQAFFWWRIFLQGERVPNLPVMAVGGFKSHLATKPGALLALQPLRFGRLCQGLEGPASTSSKALPLLRCGDWVRGGFPMVFICRLSKPD